MTTKDKTGDQLMASIRKAKTETTAPEQVAGEAQEPRPDVPKGASAPRKKAAAKAAPAAAQRRTTTKKKAAAKSRSAESTAVAKGGNFRSPGRVWPD